MESALHKFFEELTDIRKNITILKPFFKKFIVLRGLDKRKYSNSKEFNNTIKINEDEFSLKIIIPKSTSIELNSNNTNINSDNNLKNLNLVHETIKVKDALYENHLIFFDEIFTLYDNKLFLIDNILQNNAQDAFLNRDISSIFSAYFNKTCNYSDKDKKDYFCLYVSDQIKLIPNEKNSKEKNNIINKAAKQIISFNKNFIVSLERIINQFLTISAFDISCSFITKDDLILFSSSKNTEIKDLKKFDFNIIKYDNAKALSNLEKNKPLDLFFTYKDLAKSHLINQNKVELANFNSENFSFSENFMNFISNNTRGLYGIYIKIVCLKNNCELKFIYSDVNHTAINNEIIKKLTEISNKNIKKNKTLKKAVLQKDENKLFNLISEKIDFNNVKHCSCFLDISYNLDLDFDANNLSCFVGNNNKNNKISSFENSDKEYANLDFEPEKSEDRNKLINNDLCKKKGSDNFNNFNVNNNKNSFSFSRSNSFNKGSNLAANSINKYNCSINNVKSLIGDKSNNIRKETGSTLKDDCSAGKHINFKSISPNNFRKNSNANLNNINNKSSDNSDNKRNFASKNNNNNNKEISNIKGKNTDTKISKNNLFKNVKTFEKNFLSIDSDNEIISLKNINENRSKIEDLMNIEALSIQEFNAEFNYKNERSTSCNNLDSFGKSNNNITKEEKSNENINELLNGGKYKFNFDFRKFDEIVKFFKEK